LRLRSFWREWFENKDVLDIGCNAGHVTLCVARDFNPKQIVGIDIDPKLIGESGANGTLFF
jgi:7SK snRNA methylphosphate capping enzyme